MKKLFAWMGKLLSGRGQDTLASKLGRIGESKAAKFLKKQKGMRVLVRNWRQGKDEIDLVCEDRGVLVFVEVKTRSGPAGSGYYSVNRRKKNAQRRACSSYMSQLARRPAHFRFDIVEVMVGTGGRIDLHHYENVRFF